MISSPRNKAPQAVDAADAQAVDAASTQAPTKDLHVQRIQTKTFINGRIEYRGTPPGTQQQFYVVPGDDYHGQAHIASFILPQKPPYSFLLEIEPGTYSIVEASRPSVFAEPAPGTSTKVDVGKVRQAWNTPLATVKVTLGPPIDLVVIVPAE